MKKRLVIFKRWEWKHIPNILKSTFTSIPNTLPLSHTCCQSLRVCVPSVRLTDTDRSRTADYTVKADTDQHAHLIPTAHMRREKAMREREREREREGKERESERPSNKEAKIRWRQQIDDVIIMLTSFLLFPLSLFDRSAHSCWGVSRSPHLSSFFPSFSSFFPTNLSVQREGLMPIVWNWMKYEKAMFIYLFFEMSKIKWTSPDPSWIQSHCLCVVSMKRKWKRKEWGTFLPLAICEVLCIPKFYFIWESARREARPWRDGWQGVALNILLFQWTSEKTFPSSFIFSHFTSIFSWHFWHLFTSSPPPEQPIHPIACPSTQTWNESLHARKRRRLPWI